MKKLRNKISLWWHYWQMLSDCSTKPKSNYIRTSSIIHHFFGLSYCSYYTVPRLVLQEMPVWWQWCFVKLVSMLPETPGYTCQRRDKKGHFIKDYPWANYRRGVVAEVQKNEKHREYVMTISKENSYKVDHT